MNPVDENLRRRTWQLLQPGEIELNGAIVATDLGSDEDIEIQRRTVDVGEIIAGHVAPDADTWVYSGNDDPEFGANQHQGLTMDDEFVWECQQLLREGTFDLVFYYPAAADLAAILADLRRAGHEAYGVRGDRPLSEQEIASQHDEADRKQRDEEEFDQRDEEEFDQRDEEESDKRDQADPGQHDEEVRSAE